MANSHGHVGRLLVDAFQGVDLLQEVHALDDAPEHHILVVHEAERCRGCHVELASVSVGQATSLAHAEKARLTVLNTEALIRELSPLVTFYRTCLQVHTLDDAVDLGSSVRVVCLFDLNARAKVNEILAGFRSQVIKELKDNLALDTFARDGHLDVLALLTRIDLICVSPLRHLNPVHLSVRVRVRVIVEGPIAQSIRSADVVTIVQSHETLTRIMFIKRAFQPCRLVLQIMVPLGFEKLHDFNFNWQSLCYGACFVEVGVGNLPCNRQHLRLNF